MDAISYQVLEIIQHRLNKCPTVLTRRKRKTDQPGCLADCTKRDRFIYDTECLISAKTRHLPNADERPLTLKADVQAWLVICILINLLTLIYDLGLMDISSKKLEHIHRGMFHD